METMVFVSMEIWEIATALSFESAPYDVMR